MNKVFYYLFQSPKRMLIICSVFLFSGLILSGDLFKLIKLIRHKDALAARITKVEVAKQEIKSKIKESSSQEYIEREATERFDMVQDGDLIFVFND